MFKASNCKLMFYWGAHWVRDGDPLALHEATKLITTCETFEVDLLWIMWEQGCRLFAWDGNENEVRAAMNSLLEATANARGDFDQAALRKRWGTE